MLLTVLSAPGGAQDTGCRVSGGEAPLKLPWGLWSETRVIDLTGQSVSSRGGMGLYRGQGSLGAQSLPGFLCGLHAEEPGS